MKKLFLTLMCTFLFCNLFAKELKAKNKKNIELKKISKPCDSKEDLLKKLEEKKKEAELKKTNPFSLQGGDTGCKIQ